MEQALQAHELALDALLPADASLAFIGRIDTPWTRREDCLRIPTHPVGRSDGIRSAVPGYPVTAR